MSQVNNLKIEDDEIERSRKKKNDLKELPAKNT